MEANEDGRRPRREGPKARPGVQGGKRDLNRRARILSLKEAAIELFLERGTSGVTIEQIATRAKTAKGNFYRYFDSKSDVITAAFESIMASIAPQVSKSIDRVRSARSPSDVSSMISWLVQEVAKTVEKYPSEVLLYLRERAAASTAERAPIAALRKTIDDGAQQLVGAVASLGYLSQSLETEMTATVIVGGAEALIFHHMLAQGDSTLPLRDKLQKMSDFGLASGSKTSSTS